MKHFSIEKDWDAIKGQLKQRYAQLSEGDLALVEGKADELLARLREKLSLSAEDLEALLQKLRDAAGGTIEQVKGKVSEFADDARAKATEVAGEAKAQAAVAYDHARQRARTLLQEGEEYVRQNPRESLLAALGAGFVAGLLMRR